MPGLHSQFQALQLTPDFCLPVSQIASPEYLITFVLPSTSLNTVKLSMIYLDVSPSFSTQLLLTAVDFISFVHAMPNWLSIIALCFSSPTPDS